MDMTGLETFIEMKMVEPVLEVLADWLWQDVLGLLAGMIRTARDGVCIPPPDRDTTAIVQRQMAGTREGRLEGGLQQAGGEEGVPADVVRARKIGKAQGAARDQQRGRPASPPPLGSRPPIRRPAAPGKEVARQLPQETGSIVSDFRH